MKIGKATAIFMDIRSGAYTDEEKGTAICEVLKMDKTKIEWCDSTWNPVTGCLHGCEYCYARRIAQRFGGRRIMG